MWRQPLLASAHWLFSAYIARLFPELAHTFSEPVVLRIFQIRIGAEKGFRLCFHHHMGTVVQTAEETTRMLDETDAKYVHLCYDTGHFVFTGADPVAMLKKYVNRVGHVHLKDVRLPVLERVHKENLSFLTAVREGAFTVPGDGGFDFQPVFDVLDKANYTGWLLVEAEQDPAKANPFEYAKMARSYIAAHTGL